MAEELTMRRKFCDDFIYWSILDAIQFVIIVIGNVLTITALRLNRSLRQVESNLFVLNLAISDLVVGLTLPYHLAFYIYHELGDYEATCIMLFSTAILGCASSMYSMISIAVDRFIAVVYPMEYSRYVTKTSVITTMFFGWFAAIAISTMPIYWNVYTNERGCEFDTVLPHYYAAAILGPLICLIWITMFFLYWRIWQAARNHTRRLRETGYDNADLDDCKGSKVVLSIMGCFSICWIPYLLVACTRLFCINSTGIVYKASFSLAVSNSGMNPIIYAWKNSKFREAFWKLLRFKSCKNVTSLTVNQRKPKGSTTTELTS